MERCRRGLPRQHRVEIVFHQTVAVRTPGREAMIDVTREIATVVSGSGIAAGVVTLFVPHTSAGITINENADPDVTTDMLDWLRRLIPRDAGFRHAEGNSDAHLKSSLVGTSVQVPLVDGRLLLGQWQGIDLLLRV
ncbi:MAG TPA: secondary thiamine-phosphate synthase enzyme YjbQ [Tepidiformaceae bacterium]